MADPLKQICDKLGVCKEEALFYLEGFRWDLNAALEACRSKTLPPTENERAAADERNRNELIAQFVEATQASVEEARYHLSRRNWNVHNACKSFLGDPDDHTEKESNPPSPVSHDGPAEPWYMDGFSGKDEGSDSDGNTETWYPEGWGSDVMQDVLSKVPTFHNASMDLRIRSPPPPASTQPFELKQESIKQFHEFASEASPTAVLDCLNHCKGIVENAVKYYYDVYSLTHTSELIKEELLASFSSTTGETRQVANVYLEQYNWDISRATNFFFDHRDSSVPMKTPEEDVTVDDKAVEEGSSVGASRDRTTVETQTAPSTIMMTISLADGSGTELELPLTLNQTIRDIRNAIDHRYPDNDRGYYLKSMGGEVYMDLNITVSRVSTGGCRLLLQTYP